MTTTIIKKQRKQHQGRLVLLLIIVIFIFCFIFVPLYHLVCKQLDSNGRVDHDPITASANMVKNLHRSVQVDFVTVEHNTGSFDFQPLNPHVQVHLGETKLVYFYMHNTSGRDITVQAMPSIMPDVAAKYLKKTQCFCFNQQFFYQDEKADMPVYLYIDPKLPQHIEKITLSYTLLDTSSHLNKL